jgi:hypothetical protein
MSHTTTIKAIKIQSITALRMAVDDLNARGVTCTLVENVKPRAYFDDQVGMGVAPYVLQLTGAKYDIGFYASEDGSYEARTDFFGGSIEKMLGAKPGDVARAEQARMGKLYQLYGVAAATEAARKKGYMVRRIENKETGAIALDITGNFA